MSWDFTNALYRVFQSTAILVLFSALFSSVIFSMLLLLTLCTWMLHCVIPFLG